MTAPRISKSKAKQQGRPRRPHNARTKSYRSIGELAQAVGAEPRRATVCGGEVVLSQAERLCRVIVESALGGKATDLKFLIRTMADHPEIAGSSKERWELLLAGLDAQL